MSLLHLQPLTNSLSATRAVRIWTTITGGLLIRSDNKKTPLVTPCGTTAASAAHAHRFRPDRARRGHPAGPCSSGSVNGCARPTIVSSTMNDDKADRLAIGRRPSKRQLARRISPPRIHGCKLSSTRHSQSARRRSSLGGRRLQMNSGRYCSRTSSSTTARHSGYPAIIF
jgi:hypothetical protein